MIGKLLRDGLIKEISARNALTVWRRDEDKGALALSMTHNLRRSPKRYQLRAMQILCNLPQTRRHLEIDGMRRDLDHAILERNGIAN